MSRLTLVRATVLAAVTSSGVAISAENSTPWMVIAQGEDKESWEVKRGSLILSQTKSAVPMSIVVGRVVQPDNQVNLYRWYVTDEDCKAEYGKLVILDLSGSFLAETDYLKGAETLASATAEAICDSAEYLRAQKGI